MQTAPSTADFTYWWDHKHMVRLTVSTQERERV
jgi:hypothetical protein